MPKAIYSKGTVMCRLIHLFNGYKHSWVDGVGKWGESAGPVVKASYLMRYCVKKLFFHLYGERRYPCLLIQNCIQFTPLTPFFKLSHPLATQMTDQNTSFIFSFSPPPDHPTQPDWIHWAVHLDSQTPEDSDLIGLEYGLDTRIFIWLLKFKARLKKIKK